VSIEESIQMRLILLVIIVVFATCTKPVQSNGCPETGTIKKGSTLGLWCTEVTFIVTTGGSIIQPVMEANLLNGFSEGDKITFGYREVFLGMVSCGDNITTVELLCVERSSEKQ